MVWGAVFAPGGISRLLGPLTQGRSPGVTAGVCDPGTLALRSAKPPRRGFTCK